MIKIYVCIMRMKKTCIFLMAALPLSAVAQQRLSLEACRKMAVENNKELIQSGIRKEMAACDRGVARANYFPKISAQGAYFYNASDISLIDDDASSMLRNGGTLVQNQFQGKMTELTQAIMSNPAAAQEYMSSPMWQTVIGALSQTDLSAALNQIGSQIDDALHFDIQNVFVGVVSVTQPVFAGGKIIAANKIASLAKDLEESRYDTKYQEVIVTVDRAYWQIVSIAAKKKLAESYAGLLDTMEKDMSLSVAEGVATRTDLLAVKVKSNEAHLLLSKSTNGLALAKMLLCKQIGLPLDSDILLADEGNDEIPLPELAESKPMEEVFGDRPELKSLQIASQIYDNKIKVARADMMPTVAVTANYLVSNPNLNHGFRNRFGGRFAAGVVVNVPIFHAYEAGYKTKKAKAEAALYKTKLLDTKEMVSLEVSKISHERQEAIERLEMSRANMENAEENLRTATVGFAEGVVEANLALAAQTAWLQAHSEYIDAGIALQMATSDLQRAQGDLHKDITE